MSYWYVRIDSCICGFHEYQAIWDPTLDEELDCSREMDNPNDPYAVSVSKGMEIVGHVPRMEEAGITSEEAGISLHSGPFSSGKFLLVEDPDFNLKYFNCAILL